MTDVAKAIAGIIVICIGVLIFIAGIFVALALNSIAQYIVALVGAAGMAAVGIVLLTWLALGSIVIGIFAVAVIVIMAGISSL